MCFVNDVVNEVVLPKRAFSFIYAVAASLFSDGLEIINFVIVSLREKCQNTEFFGFTRL